MQHGTGVFMRWDEDGQLLEEISRVSGEDTGRTRAWMFGEPIHTAYLIRGEPVSKLEYARASNRAPRLPQYDDINNPVQKSNSPLNKRRRLDRSTDRRARASKRSWRRDVDGAQDG
jgi:hypothetical protein